ncbi:MAG: SgcJ/EcaC family oxidoreductase [Saprospiraceae bacterium]|nr:SgcJ/EcaC family oxidoreductase [Saprospiraceae bacterium]
MLKKKQKIVEILRNYQTATNTGDADLAASLYKEDSILIPANFPQATGKSAIHSFYAYAFSMLQLKLEFDINIDQIVIDGNSAYATTTSTGTRLIRESGEVVPEINRELWVFEKIDENWKIARYMFNIPPQEIS